MSNIFSAVQIPGMRKSFMYMKYLFLFVITPVMNVTAEIKSFVILILNIKILFHLLNPVSNVFSHYVSS